MIVIVRTPDTLGLNLLDIIKVLRRKELNGVRLVVRVSVPVRAPEIKITHLEHFCKEQICTVAHCHSKLRCIYHFTRNCDQTIQWAGLREDGGRSQKYQIQLSCAGLDQAFSVSLLAPPDLQPSEH